MLAAVAARCCCHRIVLLQVGVFRRGRYAAGKKVGKGNVANTGDQVKKGQTLGYVEQLGTFVEVKVSWQLTAAAMVAAAAAAMVAAAAAAS
jgi:biotin carboxyl carrier protein